MKRKTKLKNVKVERVEQPKEFELPQAPAARTKADIDIEYTEWAKLYGDKLFKLELLKAYSEADIEKIKNQMSRLNAESMAMTSQAS